MIVNESSATTATHEVRNQPPPLERYNLFERDRALAEGLRREGADWAEEQVSEFGALMGTRHMIELGFQANRYTPVLRTHDQFGNRIDEVEYHPAYHELMKTAMQARLHCLPWSEPQQGVHVARAALMYLMCQIESGILCPISMTFASVPTLSHQPELAVEWGPRILSSQYDPRFVPAGQKTAALIGMAMTEKQGGSDVRANTTRAMPLGMGGEGREYELTGHKWFCSAPMCDAFLTLAQTDKGLSCFFVPRWLPDGTRNRFLIQRLKDKLGNRSNASSEIEYDRTWARMVGEEGRGVATIIDMVGHTRFDCAITSAALMRQAVSQAAHHAAHRFAFSHLLSEQPLMQNVLADLAIEAEAATVGMLRLARAYDEARQDTRAQAFARLATAVLKYWICKRTPGHVYEAMECLGGNGYVEESIMPRLYREAPVSSIWEGSGNVISLDVLRAMARSPEALPAFLYELTDSRGADRRLDKFIFDLHQELNDLTDLESRARTITEKMALALQGALLVRYSPPAIADAFCASRLERGAGAVYGTLPAGVDFKQIIERAWH
ncbi:MAG: isovaleryl-CoA dehydrogenase [Blastocatellia bacterium]|nr:isovaleryl-CoA dehydrogenase [Blastocatellia bacterium]